MSYSNNVQRLHNELQQAQMTCEEVKRAIVSVTDKAKEAILQLNASGDLNNPHERMYITAPCFSRQTEGFVIKTNLFSISVNLLDGRVVAYTRPDCRLLTPMQVRLDAEWAELIQTKVQECLDAI